ncbi:lipoprotein [Mycoplasma mycoides]|uniref:lipoprotein n=1 Tax=Mycoplasma mycoides TaxID=2102 RepID=UPI0022400649|nr:lipoprotein [Mycoplasma mycoides]
MKKLLTLLGSSALIASSAAITVACKTPSQEIKADESDKAKKGETKEEKKAEPAAATSTVAKKEVKAKSDAEIASELTRELFLLMDDTKPIDNKKPTNETENILKKQKEKAERSVSLGTGSRRVGNPSNNVVNDWLKNFSSPKK